MMTDPIADMLTRIRNGYLARKREVTVPYSRVKFTIAQILSKAGYVGAVEKSAPPAGSKAEFSVALLYGPDKRGPIHELKRVSKPGQRVYAGYRDLPRVANDMGMAIVSTPQGLMTNKEARKLKLGGEIICEIY